MTMTRGAAAEAEEGLLRGSVEDPVPATAAAEELVGDAVPLERTEEDVD